MPVKNSWPPARAAARRVGVSVSLSLKNSTGSLCSRPAWASLASRRPMSGPAKSTSMTIAAAEGVGGLAAQRLQTEELQLLGQALGAFAVLQCQVDRFA